MIKEENEQNFFISFIICDDNNEKYIHRLLLCAEFSFSSLSFFRIKDFTLHLMLCYIFLINEIKLLN